MTAFVAGLVAGYGVAVPVGAVAVLVVGIGARTSLRIGAAAALGVATADGLYALLAVLGGAALGVLVAPLAVPLRWLAAVVLLATAAHTAYLAVRRRRAASPPAATAPAATAPAATGPGATTAPRAYAGLLALTLLNPMTIVYFTALVVGRQPAVGVGAGALFVCGAFAASASWQLLLATGGSMVGRALTGPRGQFGTAMVSSVLIAALAIGLVVSG